MRSSAELDRIISLIALSLREIEKRLTILEAKAEAFSAWLESTKEPAEDFRSLRKNPVVDSSQNGQAQDE